MALHAHNKNTDSADADLTPRQQRDVAARLAHSVHTIRKRVFHARVLRVVRQLQALRGELGRLRVDAIIAMCDEHKRRPFRY